MVRGREISMVRDPSLRAVRFFGMTCLALLSCGCDTGEAGRPSEGASSSAGPPPILELEEVLSIPLPTTLPLAGVAGAGPDGIFLWTEDEVLRLDRVWHQLLPFRKETAALQPAAAAVTERGVEVLDRVSRRIVLYSLEGERISDYALPIAEKILGAVRTSCGWFVASGDAHDQGFVLHLLDPAGSPRWQKEMSPFPADDRLLLNLALFPGSDGVLITAIGMPFSARELDCTGQERRRFESLAEPVSAVVGAETLGRSFSLSALALGEWVLQTLGDSGSGLRVLVLFDESGAVRRVRSLEVPMVFLAALPADQALVGLRQLEPTELVLYRWTLRNRM
jgi:hypothetical protein